MKGLLRRAHDSYHALSELQIIVIGSSRCLVLLWLVGVERFSNDCRKTKAITPTNHNRNEQRVKPITIPSNYL